MSNNTTWGETHEALLKSWRIYWQIKDSDEVAAERYKQEIILPVSYSISERVDDIIRLEKEIE